MFIYPQACLGSAFTFNELFTSLNNLLSVEHTAVVSTRVLQIGLGQFSPRLCMLQLQEDESKSRNKGMIYHSKGSLVRCTSSMNTSVSLAVMICTACCRAAENICSCPQRASDGIGYTHTPARTVIQTVAEHGHVYLYIRAFWGLIPVGETHVTAKLQTVGLVVHVDL